VHQHDRGESIMFDQRHSDAGARSDAAIRFMVGIANEAIVESVGHFHDAARLQFGDQSTAEMLEAMFTGHAGNQAIRPVLLDGPRLVRLIDFTVCNTSRIQLAPEHLGCHALDAARIVELS
jgi:hypothetical protein